MAWDDSKSTFETASEVPADQKITSSEWNTHVADQKSHASRHEDGGADELDAADLAAALGTAGQVLQSDGAAAAWATLVASDIGDFDEAAQDAVGTILSAQFTYDDAGDAINLDPHETTTDAHHAKYTDEEAQDAVATITSGGDKITVTYDDANDSLTIDTSALDTEEVEDAVDALLVGGTNVSLTYDDAAGTLTINATDTDTRTDVSDGGAQVVADTEDINFGTNLSVTDDGDSSVTVDASASGGSAVEAQEDGTTLSTDTALINWADGLTATEPLTDEIQVDVDESEVDHDALLNFVANEHVDHSSVSITAGTLLTGGGDLTASRTLNVDEGSISHDGIDQSTVTEDDHHPRGGSVRSDVTTTTVTASAWDSLWVDTATAGGAVTVTLPADADVSDGDRVRVSIEDGTNDTTVSPNTGQTILGSPTTLVATGETIMLEYKAATSTWMVNA